jgi:hypothetical protein
LRPYWEVCLGWQVYRHNLINNLPQLLSPHRLSPCQQFSQPANPNPLP